jgi:hypothetical protein
MAGLGAYDAQLLAQLQASAYVVQATVTQLRASTVVDPFDPDHTVIAHVDAVVFQNDEIQQLGDTWHDTITLDVRGADLVVGQHVLALAAIAVFNGGELEVAELGRIDPAAFPQAATDFPRIRALFTANPLYARVATSATIVTGTVASVASFGTGCGSEHCPDWRISNVTVDEALCGPDSANVEAGFAASNDIAWFKAPKLTQGEDGVLLLHHVDDPFATWSPDPAQLVVDPLDVHPISDRAMIEDLLADPPPLL